MEVYGEVAQISNCIHLKISQKSNNEDENEPLSGNDTTMVRPHND